MAHILKRYVRGKHTVLYKQGTPIGFRFRNKILILRWQWNGASTSVREGEVSLKRFQSLHKSICLWSVISGSLSPSVIELHFPLSTSTHQQLGCHVEIWWCVFLWWWPHCSWARRFHGQPVRQVIRYRRSWRSFVTECPIFSIRKLIESRIVYDF